MLPRGVEPGFRQVKLKGWRVDPPQLSSPSEAVAGADPRVKKFLNKCHVYRECESDHC